MVPNLTLCLLVGVLFAAGVYLLLARSIVRALIGLLLLGNGANILFLVASGPAGRAPIVGASPVSDMSDPLPQAMVLTAIVITLGTTAFLLALAHRSWQLSDHDVQEDDPEDTRITQKAESNDLTDSDYEREPDEPPDFSEFAGVGEGERR
ncbi:MAG TPA: Na(+)/H(+) antiporter subunit C [Segeticoccus sp.]|uniref:Na(+)/H(+) antiporter subunit C n=1 Tax=Segeticoccus sp. TaxID=2706531 RepID=UPI002D7F5485|nr:Na(+)/H(+) antiporter subunit C [Segeticoccus sp.]HET8600208.1 Na(+)/H(+) antiporter subunit C [Segeticoccus sp.]